MGRKRGRSNDDEQKIRKKIAKLQEKLNKKPTRPRVFMETSSSEDEQNSIAVETYADVHAVGSSSLQSPASPPPPPSQDTAEPIADIADAATIGADLEKELDADILELLGDAPKADIVLGPPVHKDIATRWQDILCKGLPKEIKDKLLKSYLVPSNCDLILAPELNPEVKAALPEISTKRDSALFIKQNQIGTALAALAVTMEKVIHEDGKQNILKPLSDACRILCDSHFSETRTRRNFVVSAVNNTLKETLVDASRDKFLFGENVTDKLKTAKSIQRSGEALKAPAPQKTLFNKNNFTKKNNLNSQHRKTFPRGEPRTARGAYSQRPATRYNMRQQQDRAPPPPPPPPRRDRSPPRRTNRR